LLSGFLAAQEFLGILASLGILATLDDLGSPDSLGSHKILGNLEFRLFQAPDFPAVLDTQILQL
jgi:hypothetical protein